MRAEGSLFRSQGSGFRVQGSRFRIQFSVFSVQCSRFSVQCSRFKVQGSGFRAQGSGFRVQGSGFGVQSTGFRVQGSGFKVCSHVTALEPVGCLRANKRTQLNAFKFIEPLVKERSFFLRSKEARACVKASSSRGDPGHRAQASDRSIHLVCRVQG